MGYVNYSIIFVAVLYFVFSMTLKRVLFSPLIFFNSYFIFSSILYLALIDIKNPYVGYIIISVLWVNMVYLFSSHKMFHKNALKIENRLLFTKAILWLTIGSGFFSLFYLVCFSHITFFSSTNILQITHSFTYIRNIENIGIPLLVRGSNVITYFGAMIFSVIFIERLFIEKRVSFICLAPSFFLVFQGFLIGTKSLLVMTLFYILSAIFIVILYHSIKVRKVKFVLSVFGVGSFFYVLVVSVHYIRALGNLTITQITEKIFTSYLWMTIAAFYESAIGENNFAIMSYNFGVNTFAGLSAHLIEGYVRRGEFVYIKILGNEYQTNLYTSFMPLMQDFGYLGALLILIFLGLILGFSSRNICKGSIRYIPLYLIVSNFFLFSFAGSLFKYLTNILAALLLFFYFLFFIRSTSKNKARIAGRHPEQSRQFITETI